MQIPTLLLACCLCQDPRPAAPAPGLDVVELTNGEVLTGRIRTQLDGYLEIELAAGATIGVSRAQVRQVRPGAGPVAAPAPSAGARGDWFVVRDGAGVPVGWLHASCTTGPDGGVRVHEEYEFTLGQRHCAVTSFADGDAALQPRACYFRERVREPWLMQVPDAPAAQRDRIVAERIVEATVVGDVLRVNRRTLAGAAQRTLDWAPTTTFALLARERVRRAGLGGGGTWQLFDPATEEVQNRTFEGGRVRTVMLDGQTLQVVELAEQGPGGRSAEWVDASARTLRRELAGPTLVAWPSDASNAMRVVVGGHGTGSALRAEPDGAFALWVPNPTWQVADPSPRQVAMASAAHGAHISLTELDHLDAGAALDTAADAVARWLPLVHPGMRVHGRSRGTVRERPCLHLSASGGTGRAEVRAEIDVIEQQGRFLVLVCRCPSEAWAELEPDFAFVRRSIEFDRAAIAAVAPPKAEGPPAAPAASGVPSPPPQVRVVLDEPARR